MVEGGATVDDVYAADLSSLFDLEEDARREETSVFIGRIRAPSDGWTALYGGQVAAQSLLAAGATLPDDRQPHSLHGYFLRRGRLDRKVEFWVDHDRDGRAFSARHVSAIQDGRVIFSMLASFTTMTAHSVLDRSPNRTERLRDPADCAPYLNDPHIEVRQITTSRLVGQRNLYPDTLWMRIPEALPDTPVVRAAALTYISDFGSGFGQSEDAAVGVGDVSLDHALWFHEPLDIHDWMVLDMWPVSAVAGRGVYHGSLRDQAGRLGATIVQENLLRDR